MFVAATPDGEIGVGGTSTARKVFSGETFLMLIASEDMSVGEVGVDLEGWMAVGEGWGIERCWTSMWGKKPVKGG
jgi:hypothetical protein